MLHFVCRYHYSTYAITIHPYELLQSAHVPGRRQVPLAAVKPSQSAADDVANVPRTSLLRPKLAFLRRPKGGADFRRVQ